jgi:hypothetical protein
MKHPRFLLLSAAAVLFLTAPAQAGPVFKTSDIVIKRQGVPPIDPMTIKHADYANYLRISIGDVAGNWQREVGDQDVTQADNALEYNPFFNFVFKTDPTFASHFETLKLALKSAASHQDAMRKAADTGNRHAFENNFDMTMVDVGQIKNTVNELRPNLLRAAAIYGVRLGEISATNEGFQDVEDTFAKNVTDAIAEMGGKSFPSPKGKNIHTPDEDELALFEGLLADLLDAASFRYDKDTAKSYVSFVNFGESSLSPWGPGNYGGVGAMESSSMAFLWY